MVMPKVRLALAQTNPLVGDIEANLDGAFAAVRAAEKSGAELVLFGEMALSGYPIEDLAARESFLKSAEEALEDFAKRLESEGLGHIAVVIGHPALAKKQDAPSWAIAQNCASAIRGGKVTGKYAKHHLPNYSVFDEYRNFVPGQDLFTFELQGLRFSTLICEDIWQNGGPVAQLKSSKTDIVLVLNGSPFEVDKDDKRLSLVQELAKSNQVAVAYVNLVGGQDDLVFDGDSILVDSSGKLVGRSKQFVEDLKLYDIASKQEIYAVAESAMTKPNDLEQIWGALVLGLRDYVEKNNFPSVILGLSGGIDSAVCASLAADAIGAKRVFGVAMPSKYSSEHSIADAADSAARIGLSFSTHSIESFVTAFETELQLSGLALENLQARMRAVILMGLSNSAGHLVLTTGNKSELAVGYSTIYGDSVGGFAPIKDIEKTLVWKLAKWRNEFATLNGQTPPIPENSISKPPSAELRPDQLDQDSLPAYELLDGILDAYVEQNLGRAQIAALGFDAAVVNRIIDLVDRAEWKRRQGAIGPKITGTAFGRDRRLPITKNSKQSSN
jgi:NAD+ synthase (glutamine-hydrolysing)